MSLASVKCRLSGSFFKNTFVFLLQIIDQFVVDLRVGMADLAVINMPAYILLVVFNCMVGDAWIIWIDLEPKALDYLAEFSVI